MLFAYTTRCSILNLNKDQGVLRTFSHSRPQRPRSFWFLLLTKRSARSWDENDVFYFCLAHTRLVLIFWNKMTGRSRRFVFLSLQKYKKRGTLGFSVLRIWPIFGSVFLFLLLKTALYRFWCFVRFAGFLQFSLWFSVFVNNDGDF